LDKVRFRESRYVRKIESYLTFLNIPQLERHGADIQNKVEELKLLNQSLKNRDKLKDDAISQLSDQLVALSSRLQDRKKTAATDLIYYYSGLKNYFKMDHYAGGFTTLVFPFWIICIFCRPFLLSFLYMPI
jgi:hypothetical protein